MRLDELINDPFKRWNNVDLSLDVLSDEELQEIVDLGEIQELYYQDPNNNRSLNTKEKIELNRIFRKAANTKKRFIL